MLIRDLVAAPTPTFSFEFFPPKTEEDAEALFETIETLSSMAPSYVSVTYGAGGSTRDRTIELVSRIRTEIGLEAMAHLTCVGHTREEIADVLRRIVDAGIENVLALRGDPPKGENTFIATEGGFHHASELVELIRSSTPLCIGVAAYPEGHIESADLSTDLVHFCHKVDCGADFAITQLFFDNRDYFRLVRDVRRQGLDVPIVPGIMPITNVSQIKRFSRFIGAKIPAALLDRLEGADPDEVVEIGVEHATAQCRELLANGAPGIHFYTLNRSKATWRILEQLRSERSVDLERAKMP